MTESICNKLEKLNPPPFITTVVSCQQTRRVIFSTWSNLRKKSRLSEKTEILKNEIELINGFITRKGTQLRLEKALLLTNRIYKLGTRWLTNRFLHEYKLFNDGVQLSLEEGTSRKRNKKKKRKGDEHDEEDDEGETEEGNSGIGKSSNGGIRLPSRQWANWIIYVTLRDTLILAKIKYECERATKYWLGLISSSHHATDSLVGVAILSRMWYVSSTMVEDFINVMYPMVCKLSIHLEPTKAENWLKDFETPEDLSLWLETVLGSPFIPASLSRGMEELGKSVGSKKAKMETVLSDVFKSASIEKQRSKETEVKTAIPSTSTGKIPSDDEEDLGVPVILPTLKTQKKKKHVETSSRSSSSGILDEHWTRFFKGYQKKLKEEKGRKQFIVRIRKYLEEETDKKIRARLVKFRKCIKSGKHDEIIQSVNMFRKFLCKKLQQT